MEKFIIETINTQTPVRYSSDEICPSCGEYSPDGDLCVKCLKDSGLYIPKITCGEEF